MIRSALPTGPCGSSTPSLHEAISIAALVVEIARSHVADALRVLVTFGDIRSGQAACITDSKVSTGVLRHREEFCGNLTPFPIPPMGGLPDCKIYLAVIRGIAPAQSMEPQDGQPKYMPVFFIDAEWVFAGAAVDRRFCPTHGVPAA